MSRIMGPVLGFRGVTNEMWNISILIVYADTDPTPQCTLTEADGHISPPTVLLQEMGKVVYRFDISIQQRDAERTIGYSFGENRWQFTVPAIGDNARLNFAYASCNGFSDPRVIRKIADKNERWRHMLSKHREAPFHLLLMGGDQVYADALWEMVATVREWNELPGNDRWQRQFTKKMRLGVEKFYLDLYCDRWAQAGPAEVLACIPTIMMWDDHDIFDGWGSHYPNQNSSPVYQGIYSVARKYFEVFQLQCSAEETHPTALDTHGANLSMGYSFGDLAIVCLDLRSERTPDQVMRPASWNQVFDWMEAQKNKKHLLVMSSIPVVHLDFSLVESALGIFPGQQELEDDLRDHWLSRAHKQERLRLIHRLFSYSRMHRSRVSILSGDVHVAALGVLRNTRAEDGYGESSINQLTSSAIVHPGPPPILMYMYDLMSRDPIVVDTGITAELVKLPAANHRFVPARNWLALEIEANSKRRLWANWHVENDEIPYTKAVHCIMQ